MTLSQEDRITMRNLHLEKAHTFLADADTNFQNDALSTAASRYYYAVFHAIHALFVMDGIYSKSHEGLNSMFSLHYVKANKLDAKFGRFVAIMENLREKADYDVLFDVTKETLDIMKPQTYELIEAVEMYLNIQNTIS